MIEVTPRFKEPKQSKTAKKKLKKDSPTARADRYFSLIVRSRGRCENCGNPTELQCAHGFSRRYRNVRWQFANAFCLCKSCHMKFTQRPLEWDDWMRARLPGDDENPDYEWLRACALSRVKLVDVKTRADELEVHWNTTRKAAAGGETTPQ